MVVFSFVSNLNAKKFIGVRATREYHHSKERHVCTPQVDQRVGTNAQQEGWECRRCLGRPNLVNGNQGTYRANKQRGARSAKEVYQRRKKEGTRITSADKELAREDRKRRK